jgi:CRISPR-associated endonuclease/helicase Cas3
VDDRLTAPLAHSRSIVASGTRPTEGHDLADHLRSVSALAGRFAYAFGATGWAQRAGAWHDLGKYRPAFQRMLAAADGESAHLECRPTSVTHSHAGALLAQERYPGHAGRVLAALIAGHHAGLPDFLQADGGNTSLAS